MLVYHSTNYNTGCSWIVRYTTISVEKDLPPVGWDVTKRHPRLRAVEGEMQGGCTDARSFGAPCFELLFTYSGEYVKKSKWEIDNPSTPRDSLWPPDTRESGPLPARISHTTTRTIASSGRQWWLLPTTQKPPSRQHAPLNSSFNLIHDRPRSVAPLSMLLRNVTTLYLCIYEISYATTHRHKHKSRWSPMASSCKTDASFRVKIISQWQLKLIHGQATIGSSIVIGHCIGRNSTNLRSFSA